MSYLLKYVCAPVPAVLVHLQKTAFPKVTPKDCSRDCGVKNENVNLPGTTNSLTKRHRCRCGIASVGDPFMITRRLCLYDLAYPNEVARPMASFLPPFRLHPLGLYTRV